MTTGDGIKYAVDALMWLIIIGLVVLWQIGAFDKRD